MDRTLVEEVNLLHAQMCQGLAAPTRILILYSLAENPRYVNELVEMLEVSQPTISRHLKVLRDIYYEQQCTQGILHYEPNYRFTGVAKYLEDRGYGGQKCPIAEEFFYKKEFNLPMNPRLSKKELDIMIEGLILAAERCR